MKINLIAGETNFEASKNALKQIDLSDMTKQNLVVVPDRFSMQAENLVFDTLKIKSSFNIEIVGISRLATKILRSNNIEFKRISSLEEVFAIYETIKELEGGFEYFKKCNLDFCVKILEIIKQFKACKIKPGQIKPTGKSLLDLKMADLKKIFVLYEEKLSEKLDLSKVLEFFIEKADKNLDLSNINLFFINFDSFTTEINSFVCRLAGLVNQTYIAYSRPISQSNAFVYEDDIFKKTTAFAKEYGVSVETKMFPPSLKSEQLLMAKNLFATSVEEGKSDFFLNVVAKNKKDEAEFVARQINFEIHNGKRFRDFAVVVPNESYFEVIKNAFEKFDISCYCDDAKTLSETILGRLYLKLLKISKTGFGKTSLKLLVSNSLLKDENSEHVLTEIDRLNINSVSEFLNEFPEYKQTIELVSSFSSCKKACEFKDRFKLIFEKIEKSYQEILKNIEKVEFFKEQSENSQARDLIDKVLEKLSEISGDKEINIEDFENLFKLSLDSVKVETIPSYIDAVFVGDATDSYFEDVDTMFVLGATANNLPKTQADTGIIDDEDIKNLKLHFALEPEIKTLNRRNRLKLFEVLMHAKNKLFVCTPICEDGGKSERASFVNDLLTMFGNNKKSTDTFENVEHGESAGRLNRLLYFLGSRKNLLDAYTELKGDEKLPVRYQGTLKYLLDEDVFKREKVENVKGNYFSKNSFSASQLETYFACPFKHFARYGLGLKEKETIEPDKRQFGLFQHALLEKFVNENGQSIAEISDEQIEKFVSGNMIEVARGVFDERILKRKYFLQYLKNEAKIILKNVKKEQKTSNFKPILLEDKISDKFFGDKTIKGYVDRVDKCGNYFRILDYKTGHVDNVKKDLFYGKKLQLFLYAGCEKKKLGLELAGVYYFDCQTKYSKYGQKSTLLRGMSLKDNDVILNSDARLSEEGFKSDILGMAAKKNPSEEEFGFKFGTAEDSFDKFLTYAKIVSKNAVSEIDDGYVLDKPLLGECEKCPYVSLCCHSQKDGYRQMQKVDSENFEGGDYGN